MLSCISYVATLFSLHSSFNIFFSKAHLNSYKNLKKFKLLNFIHKMGKNEFQWTSFNVQICVRILVDHLENGRERKTTTDNIEIIHFNPLKWDKSLDIFFFEDKKKNLKINHCQNVYLTYDSHLSATYNADILKWYRPLSHLTRLFCTESKHRQK